MTLTSPGCPAGPQIMGDVERAAQGVARRGQRGDQSHHGMAAVSGRRTRSSRESEPTWVVAKRLPLPIGNESLFSTYDGAIARSEALLGRADPNALDAARLRLRVVDARRNDLAILRTGEHVRAAAPASAPPCPRRTGSRPVHRCPASRDTRGRRPVLHAGHDQNVNVGRQLLAHERSAQSTGATLTPSWCIADPCALSLFASSSDARESGLRGAETRWSGT